MRISYDDLLDIKSELVREYCETDSTREQCDVYNLALTHFIDAIDSQNCLNIQIMNEYNGKLAIINSKLKEKDMLIEDLQMQVKNSTVKMEEMRKMSDIDENMKQLRKEAKKEEMRSQISQCLKKQNKSLRVKCGKLKMYYNQLLSRYIAVGNELENLRQGQS